MKINSYSFNDNIIYAFDIMYKGDTRNSVIHFRNMKCCFLTVKAAGYYVEADVDY